MYKIREYDRMIRKNYVWKSRAATEGARSESEVL